MTETRSFREAPGWGYVQLLAFGILAGWVVASLPMPSARELGGFIALGAILLADLGLLKDIFLG